MSHRLIVTFPTRAQDEIPASALCTASVNERRSAPHSWRVLINGHRAQTKRLRNLIPIRIVKERNTRGRARFALVSIFISLMAGFIGGFLTFNFGYAWFRNGVVVFDELSRTQPELRGILSIVRIVVLGGSAAGVLGGVAVWHWFVGVAARYGIASGRVARPRILVPRRGLPAVGCHGLCGIQSCPHPFWSLHHRWGFTRR